MLLLFLALFLFPIAVYCTILGMVNRRAQPLRVSGAWDFLGVVLATSGCLLFVGPAILSGAFKASLRELPFHREGPAITGAVGEIFATWWVLWVAYYLLLAGGIAALLWARRATAIIYNIDLASFERAIALTASRLGVQAQRLGNRLYMGVNASPSPLGDEPDVPTEVLGHFTPPDPSRRRLLEEVVVDVEPFALLHNVSLHWRAASPEARADVERELDKTLAEIAIADNPTGSWMLGIAGFLYLVITMLTATFVLGVFLATRR